MLKSILKTHVEGEEEPQGSLMPGKLTGWLASPRGAQLLPACPPRLPLSLPYFINFLQGKEWPGVRENLGEQESREGKMMLSWPWGEFF